LEEKKTTYVSRIQCIQAAIADQLGKIALEKPDLKVGLVLFNNEVTIVGDGIGSSLVITGDKLYNKEAIIDAVKEFQINAPIKESKDSLISKIYEINECGATALGPGLLASLAIAQKFGVGKVVLATDGLANVGLAKMDNLITEKDMEVINNFFTETANEALSKKYIHFNCFY